MDLKETILASNISKFVETAMKYPFEVIKLTYGSNEYLFSIQLTPIAFEIEDNYKDLFNNLESYNIQSLKRMVTPYIDEYKTWYFEHEKEIKDIFGSNNIYKSINNTLQYIKSLISENVQEEYKTYLYPRIFSNNKSLQIFESLHSKYKNQPHTTANYSFVFYAMKKDKFIICTGTEFIDFLSKEYEIEIDRVDSRQSGTNKRVNYYNEVKESMRQKKRETDSTLTQS